MSAIQLHYVPIWCPNVWFREINGGVYCRQGNPFLLASLRVRRCESYVSLKVSC